MMTIELFVSADAMSTDRRTALAERVLWEVTTEDSAPDSVMDKARELTHVIVRTPEVWVTGGPKPAAAPRYLVRVTVPGSWSNNSEFGSHIIPMITRAIAATEPDADRLFREPHCLVQIVGLREHAIGNLGRAMTGTEITKLMTEDYRHDAEQSAAPDGYTIDPVCGMTVELATTKLTLTHEGVDYAFCAPVCRKVFAEEHVIPT
ncbi:ATPase [Nocardia sp. GCM10030253]|uniref:ATPase n=1 Tax=Nocardia sp. GCM10030253 TaxID=3273404 RepID=UPI0036275DDB